MKLALSETLRTGFLATRPIWEKDRRQQLAFTVISKSPLPLLASWTDAVSIDDGFLVIYGGCQCDDVGSLSNIESLSAISSKTQMLVLAQTSHIMGTLSLSQRTANAQLHSCTIPQYSILRYSPCKHTASEIRRIYIDATLLHTTLFKRMCILSWYCIVHTSSTLCLHLFLLLYDRRMFHLTATDSIVPTFRAWSLEN